MVDLVHRYVRSRVDAGEFTGSTARKASSILRLWVEHAGPIARWDVDTVAEWVNAAGLAMNTRRSRADRLRGFMAWLVERGHLEVNLVPNRRELELPTVGASLIDEYLEWRITRDHVAPTSVRLMRGMCRQWHRHAGPLDEWTEHLAASWVNAPRLRPSTRRIRLVQLRQYVRWLVRHGHLSADITIDISAIRENHSAPRNLAASDVAALLRACPDERARLVVLLMLHCGLRCGDVARMRLEDLDVPTASLHVRAKGGAGEPTHWVPVPTGAWAPLMTWVEQLGRVTGPVFESYQRPGQPITAAHLSVLLNRWIGEAGLKRGQWDGVSAHALRHTCAQDMLDAGADLREVQYALGHRSIRSTEIYTRREPPGLRSAMEGRRYG